MIVYLRYNWEKFAKVAILLLIVLAFSTWTGYARIVRGVNRTSEERFIEGLLFDPKYAITGEEKTQVVSRTNNEVQELLNEAKRKRIPLKIVAHLRGLDGPGSSLDMPEFQVALTEAGVTKLSNIPSTPTLTSKFKVAVTFEAADNPNVIEYVAPDYGITEDEPYIAAPIIKDNEVVGFRVIKGKEVKIINEQTGYDQVDAPAYIFAKIFGLTGIRINLEDIDLMALAGGMESSNAFNVTLFAAASMLSDANYSWADIFAESVRVENEVLHGLTGGQGHLASILGGTYHHTWLSGLKGIYGAFSIPLDINSELIEQHMMLVQAGKEYENGKAVEKRTAELINQMWAALLNDQDPIGLKLHRKKLSLAEAYTRALQEEDMNKVVELVNKYVDIRDKLCKRWMSLALGIASDVNEPDVKSYAQKYSERLTTNTNLKFYLQKYGQDLANISLYTYGPISNLVETGRREGISIMPLGAGGPGSVLAAISSESDVLGEFLNNQGLELLNDETIRPIIKDTGVLKGFMPFEISDEQINVVGFDELGLESPAWPLNIQYDQITGNFFDDF